MGCRSVDPAWIYSVVLFSTLILINIFTYRYFWLHHHHKEYTPEKITSACDLKKSCLRDQKGSQNKENIDEKFHDGESFPEKKYDCEKVTVFLKKKV